MEEQIKGPCSFVRDRLAALEQAVYGGDSPSNRF
jgi:hypothetical protein